MKQITALLLSWFFFFQANGQNKLDLADFIEYLSTKYEIEFAIDHSLLKQVEIKTGPIDEKNPLKSIKSILDENGLDYYTINAHHLLLRKNNVVLPEKTITLKGKIIDFTTGQSFHMRRYICLIFHKDVIRMKKEYFH